MAQSYVGEIRPVAFTFAPAGWMLCQGQLLSIAQYDTLYALLGVTYGGDGQNTFALPDLRGRTPIHFGNSYAIGMAAGVENVTLQASQVAVHTHNITSQPANLPNSASQSPAGAFFGFTSATYYSTVSGGSTTAAILLPSGGSPQPHPNLQAYLCLNYAISLYGVFPSRN